MATRIPIALQLYSIREDCARDFAGCLKAVAKMGYQGVEFAGYHNVPAKELRKMLDDLGLIACGTHTGLNTLTGDELMKTVEFNKVLGNPYLVVPWIDESIRKTPDDARKVADTFNAIAAKVAPMGMQVGYHNHDFEFRPYAGTTQTLWDILFGNTVPSVITQADIGNALHGGADAVKCMAKYPGRATTVHLKEYSKANPKALVGDGDVRWPEVFTYCETAGKTKWYIVEYESDAYPPLVSVEKCLQNLRKMGK